MFAIFRKRVIGKTFCLTSCDHRHKTAFVSSTFSRTMSSDVPPPRYIYIASPDTPVYFRQGDKCENESESRIGRESKIFESGLDHFLVFPKNRISCDGVDLYVHSAIRSMSFYRNQDFWVNSLLAHCVQFDQHCMKRGVYINTRTETFESVGKPFFQENTDFEVFKLVKHNTLATYKLQRVISEDEKEPDTWISLVRRQSQELADILDGSSNMSPIFHEADYMPVFHDYQRTQDVLSRVMNARHCSYTHRYKNK